WRGDGLPSLFDDECFPVFGSKPHFLDEDIHDNECDNREKHLVFLNAVNLEHHERFGKQGVVNILIEKVFKLTSFIKLLEYKAEFFKFKSNAFTLFDFGN